MDRACLTETRVLTSEKVILPELGIGASVGAAHSNLPIKKGTFSGRLTDKHNKNNQIKDIYTYISNSMFKITLCLELNGLGGIMLDH